MRKKLCFTCKDPWVPGHRCMGKGEIHYIEVATDSVDSEEEEHDSGSTSSKEEPSQVEEQTSSETTDTGRDPTTGSATAS
jgi:hypothetical protein